MDAKDGVTVRDVAGQPERGLFSEERSAEVVAASFADTPDPRLRQVLTSLVQHLHAFVKDVELTEEEWGLAIDFLTRTGQMCNDVRQEFILLSDVLGVSMLVETINHRTGGTSTESTVLGPFHMVESPQRELGDNISLDGKGTPCLVSGRVTGPDGEPLAGASVDVWQTNEDGFYDVQQPDIQPAGQPARAVHRRRRGPVLVPLGRARASTRSPTTARSGSCWRQPDGTRTGRRTCTSSSAAPGYRPVTTHVFVADIPLPGLRRRLRGQGEPDPRRARGRRPGPGRRGRAGNPFRTLTFDLTSAARRPGPAAAPPASCSRASTAEPS